MTTVVDIYCRVSTDVQEDNTSLEQQEEDSRVYCRDYGLTVGMVYHEVWSGYQYREREKLATMRGRYRDGKIQGVVICTLDRLSRSQVHNAIIMEEMEHYKVTLYCVKEAIDDTPMGKFTCLILSFVAEMERERFMDRSMTGRISLARHGTFKEGPKPIYGYKWHDQKKKDYRIIDEEPAAVRDNRLARWYLPGDHRPCSVCT